MHASLEAICVTSVSNSNDYYSPQSVYVYGNISVNTQFGSQKDVAHGSELESDYRFPYEGRFFLNFNFSG
ncbi:hypothetical protein [Candidatus Parabeggiatoa sp. HSG14]|uniref:pPIWI-associating nuclease domain-containing protein n=1 Tax=Candidatus Parabeggiatoa sp. HSG14 TaxID=3055593 RepID=UPI0025A79CA8|nr:hypothetical protein [Thiotrichales bacterium HSG14]